MVTGADRKEKGRIVQFRAPIEYCGALEVIAEIINKKIAQIGGKEKVTFSDVMKLAIDRLLTGKDSFEILGKQFKISDLVEQELAKYDSIPMEGIESEVNYFLMDKYQDVVELYIEKDLELEDCPLATKDKLTEQIEMRLNGLSEAYERLGLRFELTTKDYECLREQIEQSFFDEEDAIYLQALKLFDHYRYSYLLHSLRKMTDDYIQKIQRYIQERNQDIIENNFKEKI